MRLRSSAWTGSVLKGQETFDCKNNALYSHSNTHAKVLFFNLLGDSSYIFLIKIITSFYVYNVALSCIIFVVSTENTPTEN